MILSIKGIWILIAIAFAIIEAATLSLTMIWFTIGAFCALVVSYFTNTIPIQIAVFLVISFLLLFLATKKLIKIDRDKDNTHWVSVDTNIDAVIGKRGFIVKEITPQEVGIVKVKGEEWTAVSLNDNETIKIGSEVVVKSIEGVKLIVEEIK